MARAFVRWFGLAALAAALAVGAVAAAQGTDAPAAAPAAGERADVAGQPQPPAAAGGQESRTGLNSKEGAEAPAGGGGSGLGAVMAVTLIIWAGLFVYVLRLDRKVRRLEET